MIEAVVKKLGKRWSLPKGEMLGEQTPVSQMLKAVLKAALDLIDRSA